MLNFLNENEFEQFHHLLFPQFILGGVAIGKKER
jgi:hypothetical protein